MTTLVTPTEILSMIERLTEEKPVTAPELAALLRVHPRTPSRWVRSGRAPVTAWFRTPGGHLRFWVSELDMEEIDKGSIEPAQGH